MAVFKHIVNAIVETHKELRKLSDTLVTLDKKSCK